MDTINTNTNIINDMAKTVVADVPMPCCIPYLDDPFAIDAFGQWWFRGWTDPAFMYGPFVSEHEARVEFAVYSHFYELE